MYRVMIVEDEAIVRLGLKNMLDWERLGMQVIADAADGQEAWALYEARRPDIVLTDIRMPRMDGLALIRKIRAQSARTKVVILTCLDEFALVQQALEMGVSGYLLKLTADMEEIERILLKVKGALDEEGAAASGMQWLDMAVVRDQAWDDFIHYQSMSAAAFGAFAEQTRLWPSARRLQVIVFDVSGIERLRRDGRAMNPRNLRRYIRDRITSLLADMPGGACFCGQDGIYSVVACYDGMDEEGARKAADRLLEAMGGVLGQTLGLRAPFGVSEVADGIGSLPSLHKQALSSLRQAREGAGSLPSRVTLAIRYLHEHYAENISVQTVGDALGVSANYLSHLFIRYLEESFTDYVNRLRVSHAKALLEDPAVKVYEAGERVGLGNPSYFIKVFKRATGMTPTEYREGRAL